MEGIRLNRYLALCGVASRRGAEKVIADGRVRVDGKVVLLPAFRLPEGALVTVDGAPVRPEEMRYVLLNKPAGYVCAVSDNFDPVVTELLPEEFANYRLFPVGRLDKESEGLLILTNDGMFAQEILHPSKGILREYSALLNREITRKDIRRWRDGLDVEGRTLKPVHILIEAREPRNRWVTVVLAEGVKREVRIMAKALGCDVQSLIRRKIGKMELVHLPTGACRVMTRGELWRAIRHGALV